MKVIQAYRFALDPTSSQEHALRSHAGATRFAWNWGLAKCEERYAAECKWYSAMDLHKMWNSAKKADPALARPGGCSATRLAGTAASSSSPAGFFPVPRPARAAAR